MSVRRPPPSLPGIAPTVRSLAMGLAPVLLVVSGAQAQTVTPQLLGQYLDRAGISWARGEKDPDVLVVNQSSGLKQAGKVEIVVTPMSEKYLVTLRAYALVGGKYLSSKGLRDPTGLFQSMLQNNATAFGSYFIDSDGDVGFRYVFTTESGIGFEAFRVAVNELLRIADDPMVSLYTKYK